MIAEVIAAPARNRTSKSLRVRDLHLHAESRTSRLRLVELSVSEVDDAEELSEDVTISIRAYNWLPFTFYRPTNRQRWPFRNDGDDRAGIASGGPTSETRTAGVMHPANGRSRGWYRRGGAFGLFCLESDRDIRLQTNPVWLPQLTACQQPVHAPFRLTWEPSDGTVRIRPCCCPPHGSELPRRRFRSPRQCWLGRFH